MPQDSVIRSDAPHAVNMAAGGGPALSKRGSTAFEPARAPEAVRAVTVAADASELRWAQYEDHFVAAEVSTWVVRPARITHLGRPPPKRVDFRGELRALRMKNVEVRNRLNRLLGVPQSLKKA
jgi:hypothetical protein